MRFEWVHPDLLDFDTTFRISQDNDVIFSFGREAVKPFSNRELARHCAEAIDSFYQSLRDEDSEQAELTIRESSCVVPPHMNGDYFYPYDR